MNRDPVMKYTRESGKTYHTNSNPSLETEKYAPGVYKTKNVFPTFVLVKTEYGDWIYFPEEPFSAVRGRCNTKKEVMRVIEQLANRPNQYLAPEDAVQWNL